VRISQRQNRCSHQCMQYVHIFECRPFPKLPLHSVLTIYTILPSLPFDLLFCSALAALLSSPFLLFHHSEIGSPLSFPLMSYLPSVFQKTYPVTSGTKPAYMKEMKAVRGVQRK